MLLLLSLVVVLMTANPSASLLNQMRILSGVAGVAMSLLLPRATSGAAMWRLVGMMLVGGALFMADLPGLAAPPNVPPVLKNTPRP